MIDELADEDQEERAVELLRRVRDAIFLEFPNYATTSQIGDAMDRLTTYLKETVKETGTQQGLE